MKMVRIGNVSVAAWHIAKLEDGGTGLHVHVQNGGQLWMPAPEGVSVDDMRAALEEAITGARAFDLAELVAARAEEDAAAEEQPAKK